MLTLVAIVHILVAITLVGLVLIQDSKGGGALGMGGGGGSNSLLGATGAQTLAAKMTRWTAVVFAITCITLTIMSASHTGSVVDSMPTTTPPVNAAPATPAGPVATPVPTGTPSDAPQVNPQAPAPSEAAPAGK